MNQYQYHVVDIAGKETKGVIGGSSIDKVALRLNQQGYYIVAPIVVVNKVGESWNHKLIYGRSLKDRELATLAHKLELLLKGGLPLLAALKVIKTQNNKSVLGKTVEQIKQRLEQGATLTEAIDDTGGFPQFFLQSIRIGEVSGTMPQAFLLLSTYYNSQVKLKEKLIRSMVYPAIVTFSSLVVVGLFLMFVIPSLTSMILAQGGELPTMTKVLLLFSNLEVWLVLIGVLTLVLASGVLVRSTVKGKQLFTWFCWHLPLISRIYKAINYLNLSRGMGFMLSSGISLLEGLEKMRNDTHDQMLLDKLSSTILSLNQGQNLANSLESARLFTLEEWELIKVSEQLGRLAEVFQHLGDNYQEQLDNYLVRLNSLVEPVLILVLTGLVTIIVAGILLPLYEVSNFSF